MNSNSDYILLQVHVSNSDFFSTIKSMDYSEEIEQEAGDSGQVFCDKDTFLQLFVESDSINPFLIELI